MKYVLITGGAGGIGRALSEYFSNKGWRVFSCDITEQSPEEENIVPVHMDIRSAKSVAEARAIVEKETNHLDAIINSAGIYIMDSLVEVPEEDFLRIFDINVNGVYRVNREFVPLVKKGGRIIIITSELSRLNPLPFNGLYSITKTTLETYAHSLRLELALIDVPVITIRPGAVDTKLLNESFSSMRKMCNKTRIYKMSTEKFLQIMNKSTSKPMAPQKLAGIIYSAVVASRPWSSYTVGAGLALQLFSALPAKIQVAILKKLLK